jgi:hypothetical protein
MRPALLRPNLSAASIADCENGKQDGLVHGAGRPCATTPGFINAAPPRGGGAESMRHEPG